jgi:hypothetical protein
MLFQSAGMAVPTIEELLSRCTETLDKTHTSFITQSASHINSKIKSPDPQSAFMNGERDKFLITEFRTDGDRIKVITQMWGDFLSQGGKKRRTENEKQYSSDTYDGNKRYNHVRPYDSAGRVTVYDDGFKGIANSLDIQLAYKDPVSQCFGYLIGDVERFDRILKKVGHDQVSVREEAFNGTIHYVIEAKTDRGRYKIWLSPEKGYNYSKAIVVREAGDLFMDDHILEAGTSNRSMIENTDFKQIDNVWIPIKTTSKMNYSLPNNGFIVSNYEIELTSIQINPDHDALDSFSIDDIKDGAKAMIHGISIPYIWRDGKLIPDVDREAIEQLDMIIDEILVEQGKKDAPDTAFGTDVSISLAKILSEYAKTQERLAVLCYDGVSTEEGRRSVRSHYAQDRARFGVRIREGGQLTGGFIRDASKTVHCVIDSAATMQVSASADLVRPYQLLAELYPGAPLLGYLDGQPERIDALLSKAADAASVAEDTLDEKRCYVVTAPVGGRTYRVWFSPDDGYHIVKAEIHAEAKTVYQLDQVQFNQIDEVTVPSSCAVRDARRQYEYERSLINLKPDFAALRAFELPIPNRTPVSVDRQPDGGFVWVNGRVVDAEGNDAF